MRLSKPAAKKAEPQEPKKATTGFLSQKEKEGKTMKISKPAVKATEVEEPKAKDPKKAAKAMLEPEPEPKPKKKVKQAHETTPFGSRVGSSAAQIDLLLIGSKKGITAQEIVKSVDATMGRVRAHLRFLTEKRGLPITPTQDADGRTTYSYKAKK